jgi:hypothetical protein
MGADFYLRNLLAENRNVNQRRGPVSSFHVADEAEKSLVHRCWNAKFLP